MKECVLDMLSINKLAYKWVGKLIEASEYNRVKLLNLLSGARALSPRIRRLSG
jgi:hypothetical protein